MRLSSIGNPSKVIYSSLYVISDSASGEIVMTFDSIDEVSFKASSNVTSYPTEKGISVVDYKYDNPDTLDVIGIISRASFIGNRYGQDVSAKAETVEKTRTELEHYKSGIYKLDIQTKAALRQGYTLTSYEIPENIDNYSQFEVTMRFVQVKSLSSYNPVSDSDSDTVSLGEVQVKEQQ